jgi:hypothetical protein
MVAVEEEVRLRGFERAAREQLGERTPEAPSEAVGWS